MVIQNNSSHAPASDRRSEVEENIVERQVVVSLAKPGSPAEALGLDVWDILLTYNGAPVIGFKEFIEERRREESEGRREPGKLVILHHGEQKELTLPPGPLGLGLQNVTVPKS